jgi:uncharacterized lipoprotein YddW (UPF0748 family)
LKKTKRHPEKSKTFAQSGAPELLRVRVPAFVVFSLLIVLMLGTVSCSFFETGNSDQNHHGEVRGVWITNVDSDVLFSKEAIAEAMDYLADRGFNIVFPVVWNKGLTLYPSQVMADYFGEEFRIDTAFAAGRDPLQELIVEARRNGMEVMPWFEFGFSSSYQDSGGYILQRYPHWAAKDVNGDLLAKNGFEWMNGLHPEVQDFMLALIREVMVNYDIDGIQGDDRLPAMPAEGGYSDYTRTLYQRETGRDVPDDPREPRFLQWKADKLTAFGGRLHTMVKNYDPDLMVSLSPSIYPWSLTEYLQDWPAWMRRGQVDLLHPQNYRYEIERYISTADTMVWYAGLTTDTDGNRYIPAHDIIVTPGILIKAGPRYNGPDYVMKAVEHNRKLGLPGEVYFFYEGLDASNEFLADTLRKYVYTEPAGLPHRHGNPRITPAPVVMAAEASLGPAGAWEEVTTGKAFGESWFRSRVASAEAAFEISAVQAGNFQLYVHYPFAAEHGPAPEISVKTPNGIITVKPQYAPDASGWLPVTGVSLNEPALVSVTLSGGNGLAADAVMLLQSHKKPVR